MHRQELKVTVGQKELEDDIQFLLSSIRARQNGLIFFLQHFSHCQYQHSQQYQAYKNQFIQKQKIYTIQVSQIINKYTNLVYDVSHYFVRGFWLKLKSILKISLERIKILQLMSQRIYDRYQDTIKIITQSYDQIKGIAQFRQVQASLKKRNLDALIVTKKIFLVQSPKKLIKNKSEILLNVDQILENPLAIKLENQQQRPHPRMKSLNRYSKIKRSVEKYRKNISQKACQKHYRRFMKNIEKYEKNYYGVMDGKLQTNFDKKKSIFENVYGIYDQLFQKNIPIHKSISKYLFNNYGMSKIVEKKNNKQLAKPIVQNYDHYSQHRRSSKINKNKITKKIEVNRKIVADDEGMQKGKTMKYSKVKKQILNKGNTLNPRRFLSKIM